MLVFPKEYQKRLMKNLMRLSRVTSQKKVKRGKERRKRSENYKFVVLIHKTLN